MLYRSSLGQVEGLGYQSAANVKPRGARILSWVTLLAISPPRSSAMAPTMAYNEVVRTDSRPEDCRLSVYAC